LPQAGAPALLAHNAANEREGRRKENAEQNRIDAHGHSNAMPERFAYRCDARD